MSPAAPEVHAAALDVLAREAAADAPGLRARPVAGGRAAPAPWLQGPLRADTVTAQLRALAALARAHGLGPLELDLLAPAGAATARAGGDAGPDLRAAGAAAGATWRLGPPADERPARRVEARATDARGRSRRLGWLDASGPDAALAVAPPAAWAAWGRAAFDGAPPLWAAAEVARVLPVGPHLDEAAHAVAHALAAAIARACPERQPRVAVEVGGPLRSRIGAATAARVPLVLVLGPAEAAAGLVQVRARGAVGAGPCWPLAALADALARAVAGRLADPAAFAAPGSPWRPPLLDDAPGSAPGSSSPGSPMVGAPAPPQR